MLRLRREEAREPQACRSVLWPVTVHRVELVTAEVGEGLDPFELLVLDCAAAGESDPERIAALSGLPRSFVASLQEGMRGGLLDAHLRITPMGEERRAGIPEEAAHVGFMMRDDLTSEVLPVFLSTWPGSEGPPEGLPALPRLYRGHARRVDDLEWLTGFVADHRVRRRAERDGRTTWLDEDEAPPRGTVRLLDEGVHQELRVEVWAEVDPIGLPPPHYRLTAGCPFGRAGQGARYLQRLRGPQAGLDVLREVEIAAAELVKKRQAEIVDGPFQATVREAVAELLEHGPVPEQLREDLRRAVLQRARVGRDSGDPKAALNAYGSAAEGVLVVLSPRGDRRPSREVLAEALDALPGSKEGASRALHGRIEGLLPEDAEGRGLAVPGHLDSSGVITGSITRCRKAVKTGGRPSFRPYGLNLQVQPFAMAALLPDSGQGAQVRRALLAEPGLWKALCEVLDLRNAASHHDARGEGPDRVALAELVERAHGQMGRVMAAVFGEADGDDVNDLDQGGGDG